MGCEAICCILIYHRIWWLTQTQTEFPYSSFNLRSNFDTNKWSALKCPFLLNPNYFWCTILNLWLTFKFTTLQYKCYTYKQQIKSSVCSSFKWTMEVWIRLDSKIWHSHKFPYSRAAQNLLNLQSSLFGEKILSFVFILVQIFKDFFSRSNPNKDNRAKV